MDDYCDAWHEEQRVGGIWFVHSQGVNIIGFINHALLDMLFSIASSSI